MTASTLDWYVSKDLGHTEQISPKLTAKSKPPFLRHKWQLYTFNIIIIIVSNKRGEIGGGFTALKTLCFFKLSKISNANVYILCDFLPNNP